MVKIKFSKIFITLGLLIPHLLAYNTQVISEGPTQFSFTIRNEESAKLKQDAMDSSITNIEIAGADYELIHQINLPFWNYKIALPNTIEPTITLSNIVWQEVELDLDPENNEAAFARYQSYKIQQIGLAGKVPTMFLSIFPINYDSQAKTFRQITSVRVTIQYSQSFQYSTPNTSDASYFNRFAKEEFSYPAPIQKALKPSFTPGKWYRVAISDKSAYDFNNEDEFNNIFKITYDDLKDAGLTESDIAKSRIFLYANNTFGQMITEYIPSSLMEIPRSFFDNTNSSFSEGDYIIFYGKSPTGQYINFVNDVDFLRNPYSFNSYFWVHITDSEGDPKEIEMAEKITATPDYTVDSTDYLWHKEKENYNVLDSGNDWYNKIFNGRGTNNVEYFVLPSGDQNYQARITLRLKSGTEAFTGQKFNVYLNSNLIHQNIYLYSYTYSKKTLSTLFKPRTNTLRIDQVVGSGTNYLDYVQATYRIQLSDVENKLIFYAPEKPGNIKYVIDEKLTDTPRIFDISNKFSVQEIPIDRNGSEITFTDYNPAEKRKTYLLTSQNNYSEISSVSEIENPDFTSLFDNKDAQYVIITDEMFLGAAEKIAEIHNSGADPKDRLTTFITTQKNIFRQFNGDLQDPEAIRTFLKYAYQNWSIKPEYLLLLGDGTYDHREIKSESKNYVMTYQVWGPQHDYDYYASDFKFTYLSDGDLIPDLAPGRVPVATLDEAENYVEKLEDYLLDPNFGSWRSVATFVADDPTRPNINEPEFVRDSETLTNSIFPQSMNFNKIYLTEYPESQDESKYGVKKPAATEAIHEALSEGTILINYIGHGGPDQWTQEDAFSSEELPNVDNLRKLPVWIAGTCTWGKYDEVLNDCMPEKLLTMKADGAISCMGASRPTTNFDNFSLFSKVFNYWFNDDKINRIRTGDLLKQFVVGNDKNDAKYVLFGDPAMYLAMPFETGEFNNLEKDTLKALQNVKISGTTTIEDFTGKAIISLYDSKQNVTRFYTPLNTSEQRPISYKLPGDVLFKGNISVEKGEFNSSFFIPKDLNYSNDFGKLHIYGWNEESQTDFIGVYNSIVFAGSENIADSTGPKITVMKNDQVFFDGGIVNNADIFALRISDEHGINLTGKMGHTISLEFNESNTIQDLTSAFSYEEGSDTSGFVAISLPEEIEPGTHFLRAKAWDNANNSTAINFSFTYTTSENFKLSHIINYPNPFRAETDITFYTSDPCDFSITIYTLNGLKIKEFSDMQSELNGYNQVHWDGKDDFGDDVAKGTYLYKIRATSIVTNKKDTFIGKMVKG